MAATATKMTTLAVLARGCMGFVAPHGLRGQSASTGVASEAAQQQNMLIDAGVTNTGASNAALGLAVAATASSLLAISAARSSRRVQKTLSTSICALGLYGPGEFFTEKWDPLNMGSTDAKMERYTAVEIKHGRISMLATAGYILPHAFRFPGCENFTNGLGAFDSIPVELSAGIFALVAAHEIGLKPRKGGMGAYDLGFGTELLEEIKPEEFETRSNFERINGRLAMVAIMGMMVQDGMFGMDPIAYGKLEGWWGAPVDFLVRDIPMCLGGCALKRRTNQGPGVTARRAAVYESENLARIMGTKFEMSKSMPFLKYPMPLKGWVGGEKGFDPLNVTMALPVNMVREAELKHGRVCMLAAAGWIATDLGARFPGEVFQKATTLSAHNDCVAAGYMLPGLAAVACLELYGGWLFMQMLGEDLKRDAGDFYLGKNFLPKDPVQADQMRYKEIENGRLAMLAFSGMCTQAALGQATGQFPSTFPFM